MIKKTLKKTLTGLIKLATDTLPRKRATKSPAVLAQRVQYAQDQHGISRKHVHPMAITVCETLQQAGFAAYIVGGAVRDLLLGLTPKDFDVATDATPEQVKRQFRRAFIIGRRFRIVHVIFGRGREHEVIEVTTFRANVDSADATQVSGNERTHKQSLHNVEHAVDASGRLLRDNVWGSQADDATRRDFTVNAMYYDPVAEVVVDFHRGMADVKAKRIRMIGDASQRYREDPVRVLRALRFTAKLSPLGFRLDRATAQPLAEAKAWLADIPPSRLFDEMLKLLQTGHALSTVATLKALKLDQGLYPLLDVIAARSDRALVQAVLQETDARVQAGKPVIASYLLACILWADVQARWAHLRHTSGLQPQAKSKTEAAPAALSTTQQRSLQAADFALLQQAVDEVFESRIADVSGRGKLGNDMRDIWLLQPRFMRRHGKSALALVKHLRFRPALGLWRLRVASGDTEDSALLGADPSSESITLEQADWWETFYQADEEARKALQLALPPATETAGAAGGSGRSRSKNRGRAPRSECKPQDAATHSSAQSQPTEAKQDDAAQDNAPARKRRPRRRKPKETDSSPPQG